MNKDTVKQIEDIIDIYIKLAETPQEVAGWEKLKSNITENTKIENGDLYAWDPNQELGLNVAADGYVMIFRGLELTKKNLIKVINRYYCTLRSHNVQKIAEAILMGKRIYALKTDTNDDDTIIAEDGESGDSLLRRVIESHKITEEKAKYWSIDDITDNLIYHATI
jgi:hypothetical protein